MHKNSHGRIKLSLVVALLALSGSVFGQQEGMSFFVSSTGSGKGADFGGLAGADRHCQRLAEAAGAGKRTWRAYLSTSGGDGGKVEHARDRIGKGPWRNARGVVIANSLQELHGTNNISKETALTEKGEAVKGRGDSPNMHDILTGTRADGTAFPPGEDRTCGDWTKSGEGSAFVGHHDRMGLRDDEASRSWNASHASRGCSDEALRATGGAGLIYCFAAD